MFQQFKNPETHVSLVFPGFFLLAFLTVFDKHSKQSLCALTTIFIANSRAIFIHSMQSKSNGECTKCEHTVIAMPAKPATCINFTG